MKIGIITQPLHTNYGGLLQNYALQQVLRRLGHEVYTINRSNKPGIYTARWDARLKFRIKQLIKKHIGREYALSHKDFLTTRQHCLDFVSKNIATTPGVNNNHEYLRTITVTVISSIAPFICYWFMQPSAARFFTVCSISVLASALCIYHIGCNNEERRTIINVIAKIKRRISRK